MGIPGWLSNMKTLLCASLLAPFTLVSAFAQDPWQRFLDNWQHQSGAITPWVLVVPSDTKTSTWWKADPDLLNLVAGRDLAIEMPTREQVKDVWEAKGWKDGMHWVLIGRKDQGQGRWFDGEGLPVGQEVKSAIQGTGFRDLAESLDEFLKQNPENGIAHQTRVLAAMRLMRYRLEAEVTNGAAVAPIRPSNSTPGQPGLLLQPEVADRVFEGVVAALERFRNLPDWWRSDTWWYWGPNLEIYDAGSSPRMRQIMWKMREDVLSEWAKTPHSGEEQLGAIWFHLSKALKDPFGLPQMEILPGHDFPSLPLISNISSYYATGQNWERLLAFLDSIQNSSLEGATEAQRKAHSIRETSITFTRAYAHAGLGNKESCLGALREARRLAGPTWEKTDYLQQIKNAFPTLFPPDSVDLQGLTLPDLGPNLVPSDTRLRLLMVGRPTWKGSWASLGKSEAFAEWGPDEFSIGVATSHDERWLGQLGKAGSGWVLVQGANTLIANWADSIDPGQVADRMRQIAPPVLDRLQAFIRNNPDHLDARKARVELLQARRHSKLLEAELANDVVAARVPLSAATMVWVNTPDLWYVAMRKARADAEDELMRWPNSKNAWQILVSWNIFQGAKPIFPVVSAAAVFGSRSEWASGLPKELHLALFKELKAAGRLADSKDWFELAWKGLCDQATTVSSVAPESRDVLYRLLRETYLGLRLQADVRRLDRELKDLSKGKN